VWLSGTSSCDTGFRDPASLVARGWEDADTEALELNRHKRVLADGRDDDCAETCGLLFDAAGDARRMEFRSMRYAILEKSLDRRGH
jgi:hypothetical protein